MRREMVVGRDVCIPIAEASYGAHVPWSSSLPTAILCYVTMGCNDVRHALFSLFFSLMCTFEFAFWHISFEVCKGYGVYIGTLMRVVLPTPNIPQKNI